MKHVIAFCIICAAFLACQEEGPPLAGDGEACHLEEQCEDELVCTGTGRNKAGMCLRPCIPADPDPCGPESWCTIAEEPPAGMKCTPPIP